MILYEEILKDFARLKVRYVLVGGIAVNLLGPARSTVDLDLLVEMSDNNLRKIVTVMKKHGYKVRQPVDPMGIADETIRNNWINEKHMRAFNFYNDKEFKEVDLVIHSPVSFERAIKKAKKIRAGKLLLPVISIDHLIKMKQAAGRPIDQMDIHDLRRVKRLKK